MRISQLLERTLRETPKDAEIISHDLLVRAGYIRQLGAGIFTYMHLAHRSITKIRQIMREEMDAIGGVEISMPFVHPAEVWKKTNRWYDIDESLVRFKDRTDRDMVLAMTHEEVVAELAKSEISSYKQLPKLVYQMHDKFRDEARSRAGLIRVREFIMKDSYSLDKDWEGLEKQYDNHYIAYFKIYTRTDLPVLAILSDTGMMGGKIAHEYMYITPIGEDTIFVNEKTGYQANKEVATFKKIYPKSEPKTLEKVHTPQQSTISSLAEFLKISEQETAKVVLYWADWEEESKLVMVIIRGDMEVNPIKVQKLIKSKKMRPATIEEIQPTGIVAGYASAIGIDHSKVMVVADDYIAEVNNLVAGANEVDQHYINTCYGRDYTAAIVGDVAMCYEGALSPNADQESEEYQLKAVRGVEVGNIFQLGTKYTAAMGATFKDEQGKEQPIIMGSYGIGLGRLLACVVEEHHDERGLKMPITIAPYHIHFVALPDTEEIKIQAEELYKLFQKEGLEVLFDDRDAKMATAGVKFGDADLIGLPIRLTLSKRSLQNGGLELKLRREEQSEIVATDKVVEVLRSKIQMLEQEIKGKVEVVVKNIH